MATAQPTPSPESFPRCARCGGLSVSTSRSSGDGRRRLENPGGRAESDGGLRWLLYHAACHEPGRVAQECSFRVRSSHGPVSQAGGGMHDASHVGAYRGRDDLEHADAPAPEMSGSVLDGRYELHTLGVRAVRRVYVAETGVGPVVPLKVIKPWWAEDPLGRTFEASATARARQRSGIVQIFDVGQARRASISRRVRGGRGPRELVERGRSSRAGA